MAAVACVAALGQAATTATAQCGGLWLSGDDQGVRGVAGSATGSPEVLSAAMWDSDGDGPLEARPVIGGLFELAGTAAARGIAVWSGDRFEALGEGLGWWVEALAIHDGALIASGTTGNPLNLRASRWNGTIWEPLGGSVSLGAGRFRSATTFGGDLVLAGSFSSVGGVQANSIVRWNGKGWSSLGDGLSNGSSPASVYALAVHDGELIAAGNFTHADGAVVNHIARWDGSQWRALGLGLTLSPGNAIVFDLAVHDGELFAVGNFSSASGVGVPGLARWNGSAWAAVPGASMPLFTARRLAVHQGALVVGGTFSSFAGLSNLNGLARWNGAEWQGFAGGLSRSFESTSLDSLEFRMVSSGDALFVGGNFLRAGALAVERAAMWRDGGWKVLASGLQVDSQSQGRVSVLCSYDGALVAGGRLVAAGEGNARRLAMRTEDGWRSIGGGVDGTGQSSSVEAAIEFEGELVVGGFFTSVDGVNAASVARWNGSAWEAMGAGFTGGTVRALHVHQGELFAGLEGGVGARGVFRWDGAAWSALGGHPFSINALASHQGELVASGSGRVDRWDGSQWLQLGGNFAGGGVAALAVYQGELLVGGSFTSVSGSASAAKVARWNGSSWSSIGFPAGLGGVEALVVYNGSLIAAGQFSTGSKQGPIRNIARWDGSTWSPLGGGVEGSLSTPTGAAVYALHVFGDELIVGGRFYRAGSAVSAHWARWRDDALAPCRADFDGDGVVGPVDLSIMLGSWGVCLDGGPCVADLTCDAEIGAADLAILLGSWGTCAP